MCSSDLLYDCIDGHHGKDKIDISNVGAQKDFHYVIHSLRIATHYFLHTNSFEQALIECVNHGGDTDTNAAICGAMAGTYYGMNAIPKRWLENLNVDAPMEGTPKVYYSVSQIETIAKRLYQRTNKAPYSTQIIS